VSNLGNEKLVSGHVKGSRGPNLAQGPQVSHPWLRWSSASCIAAVCWRIFLRYLNVMN